MTKKEKVIEKMKQDKNLVSRLKKYSYTLNSLYDDFVLYIKGTKKKQSLCVFLDRKQSGATKWKIFIQVKKNNHFFINNFGALFYVVSGVRCNPDFVISLPFMNMDPVFAIHYNLIFKAKSLGLISKSECDRLSQSQPRSL